MTDLTNMGNMHSLEAEQAVLGGLILNNEAFPLVSGLVGESAFFLTMHREIFGAIRDLYNAGQPFDVVTLSDGKDIQTLRYVGEMARSTPSAANIEAYATIVAERYRRRLLFAVGVQAESCARSDDPLVDGLASVRQALDGIGQTGARALPTPESMAHDWLTTMLDRANNPGRLLGLDTGYPSLNARWGGLCPSDLIVVGGRPSMGKTTFGMNLAENAAASGHTVLVFSMEMSTAQLMDRRISSIMSVRLGGIRDGSLDGEELEQCIAGAHIVKSRSLHIDDRSGCPIDTVRMAATAHHAKHGTALVVVDYLQQMSAQAESRTQEVRKISAGLKKLAKDLNIPVIALAQLNRLAEARANKRPMMSDLRESGDIEQDADIIAFVHREEKYSDDPQWQGVAEIISSKVRNGEIGTDYMEAQLQFSRFREMSSPFRPPSQKLRKLRETDL